MAVVYVGEFEAEYLEVPQECLILTMQQNQKYFPLLDPEGKLLNRFLIVANMQVDDPSHIIQRQRARRSPAPGRRTLLLQPGPQERFRHPRRSTRRRRLSQQARLAGRPRAAPGPHRAGIAEKLGADGNLAERAGLFAKIDLLTDMVGEFPELQGIMGRYYLLHEGGLPVVADAIEQHYRPRFAGDALPQGNIACAAALADKLDALVGFFGIGQLPTGDKDPFGLRRAALGVLRILMETPLPLDLVS
jgi:glycyl-tRNA synthetase beta chain